MPLLSGILASIRTQRRPEIPRLLSRSSPFNGTHKKDYNPRSKGSSGVSLKWQQIATEFVSNAPCARSWAAQGKLCGYDLGNGVLVVALGGYGLDLSRIVTYGSAIHPHKPGAANSLVASAESYARETRIWGLKIHLIHRLHNFRVLVFLSLCICLSRRGSSTNAINNIIRLCISDSEGQNLLRFRVGSHG